MGRQDFFTENEIHAYLRPNAAPAVMPRATGSPTCKSGTAISTTAGARTIARSVQFHQSTAEQEELTTHCEGGLSFFFVDAACVIFIEQQRFPVPKQLSWTESVDGDRC